MTGGAMGSLFAQLFHLSNAERKTLLVAGAAAGMSATFGTPVAAMLLAVELLLFEWKPRSFVPVAVAAVVAAAWRSWALGTDPLFPLASSAVLPPSGLLLCVGLGVAAGLGSGLLTAMVYGSEDLFERLPIHWMWWPAVGGVAIGLGGLIEPHALGVGYDNISALLRGDLISGTGAPIAGGEGADMVDCAGIGHFGRRARSAPDHGRCRRLAVRRLGVASGMTGVWALIGMSAMMAGTMRAPLTAMMFGVELTHDIHALLPLAAGCAAAHATTVLLLKRSILTERIARRGHHIVREYSVDPFEAVRIADIMARPAETVSADASVGEIVDFFTASNAPRRHKSYPVTDQLGRLVGIVSRADALQWMMSDGLRGNLVVEQLSGQELIDRLRG